MLGARQYEPRLRGLKPPGGVRIHIAGVDLIRDPDGVLRVLEDNLRTPSGVSYVIENRLVTKRMFPPALDRRACDRVDHYPTRLAETLRSVSPVDPEKSTVVVLTPGPYNSAYFEHSFLARTMGLELVEAPDLFVDDDKVFCAPPRPAPRPRHLPPHRRRVPRSGGLPPRQPARRARASCAPGRAGNVALANAPGNGVADDKAVYPFVPDMIRFYLGEEPLLEQVPTYVCARRRRPQVRARAPRRAGGQGGRRGGRLRHADGPAGDRRRARGVPRAASSPSRASYIAQHRIELSTCPTWIAAERRLEPRRVDLRPYVLTGKGRAGCCPAASRASRCATARYVVNSSQGGGSKDTWVQADAVS